MFSVCLGIIALLMISKSFTDCIELPENACHASLDTISYVTKCPTTTDEYIIAARRKGCSRYNNTCNSFEYHCVINERMTSLVEVCAPSRFILSGKCTEFNKECQCIRKSYFADCTQFSTPCPPAYNSTASFLYSQCHEMISLTTDRMPNNSKTDKTTPKHQVERENNSLNSLKIVVPVSVICPLLIIIILITFFTIRQWRKKGLSNNSNKESPEEESDSLNPSA